MELNLLVLSDENAINKKLDYLVTGLNISLEIRSHNNIINNRLYCYDIICLIDDKFSRIEESLFKLSERSKSYGVIIFTNDLSKPNILRCLELGADIVNLNDFEVISKQFEVMNERLDYYVCPVYLGDLVFDSNANSISSQEKTISLSPFETRLMKLFVEDVGELVPFHSVSKCMDEGEYPDVKEYTKVYVHKLRKALKQLNCKDLEIVNHYGKGYSLELIEV